MTQNLFHRIFTSIANIGVESEDSPELRLKKALLSISVFIYSVVFITFTGPLYLHFGESIACLLYTGFGIVSLAGLIWFAYQPKIFRVYLFLVFSLAFVAELVATIVLGGFMNSSGLPMWGLLTVFGALIQYGPRQSLYWFLANIANLLLIVILQINFPKENHLPSVVILLLFILNFILISGFAYLSLYFFSKQRDLAFLLLREERQKSENLLLNILPKEIASILKSGKNTIADHYEQASILFADLVDFTSLSESMTPSQLVELLNDVFSYFDLLAEKHGLEKIKTIGDCYMVASGVPIPRVNHAQDLTRMALEMRDYICQNKFSGRGLIFRIGINSGPVVAGVIGRKKFIYDLWGDAVNTASRMESHGEAGAIQITETTYELIKDVFVCDPQGRIHVKGKGEMNIWHVVGEKSEAS